MHELMCTIYNCLVNVCDTVYVFTTLQHNVNVFKLFKYFFIIDVKFTLNKKYEQTSFHTKYVAKTKVIFFFMLLSSKNIGNSNTNLLLLFRPGQQKKKYFFLSPEPYLIWRFSFNQFSPSSEGLPVYLGSVCACQHLQMWSQRTELSVSAPFWHRHITASVTVCH